MAFLEQGFKTGQFLRLDGSHFDARTGLHHTTRRCSLFRWRFHPSPSHRKTRKLSRTKSNPSTSASYKTRRRNPASLADGEMRHDLHAYLAATSRPPSCPAIQLGGIADHVHIACGLARTLSV